MSRKPTPQPPARPDQSPGYPEHNPRDKTDAQRPADTHQRNPDDGGLDREPERMPED